MSKERSVWWGVAYLLFIPFTVYLWGWTFSVMWSWFLVAPLRVVEITVWQAMGILMTLRYATIDWNKKVDWNNGSETKNDFSALLARDVLLPLMFLGIGAVIKYFM